MDLGKHATLSAIVFGLGFHAAAHAAQEPNFYNFVGKSVSLTFAVGSGAEVGIAPPTTTLNLRVGKDNYSFQEAEITSESTLIGDLKEVTLEHIPDLHVKYASVVIPSISLGASPVDFKSQLVLTTVETPFAPGVLEGVANPSKYIDLACTASIVYY